MGIVSQYGLSFYTIDRRLSMGFFILFRKFSVFPQKIPFFSGRTDLFFIQFFHALPRMQQNRTQKSSRSRELSFFDIPNDLFNRAIQSFTQCIQRLCTDRLPFLDAVQCIGRESLLIYQIILSNILFKQGIIKGFITDHFNHHNQFIMLNALTMPNKLSIMIRNRRNHYEYFYLSSSCRNQNRQPI